MLKRCHPSCRVDVIMLTTTSPTRHESIDSPYEKDYNYIGYAALSWTHRKPALLSDVSHIYLICSTTLQVCLLSLYHFTWHTNSRDASCIHLDNHICLENRCFLSQNQLSGHKSLYSSLTYPVRNGYDGAIRKVGTQDLTDKFIGVGVQTTRGFVKDH
jgi:hypothetical protein